MSQRPSAKRFCQSGRSSSNRSVDAPLILPDLDIYRSAAVLVREHGEDATLEAAKDVLAKQSCQRVLAVLARVRRSPVMSVPRVIHEAGRDSVISFSSQMAQCHASVYSADLGSDETHDRSAPDARSSLLDAGFSASNAALDSFCAAPTLLNQNRSNLG